MARKKKAPVPDRGPERGLTGQIQEPDIYPHLPQKIEVLETTPDNMVHFVELGNMRTRNPFVMFLPRFVEAYGQSDAEPVLAPEQDRSAEAQAAFEADEEKRRAEAEAAAAGDKKEPEPETGTKGKQDDLPPASAPEPAGDEKPGGEELI